ncbi:MAG: putative transposase [Candidatus Azotimanducaceae bacterium]|jgi:putative transposase
MARRPRNYLKGYTYHLVQRGVNRARTFFKPEDYFYYLTLWRDYSTRTDLQVHAYCLMGNHVHFLVTPQKNDSISNTTRLVGSRYAAWINKQNSRTGTLWEGRHWSSLIDSDNYLLRCYRYIELNPVRARLCLVPEGYLWSSYHLNTGSDTGWLEPHPLFLELGSDQHLRSEIYAEFVKEDTSQAEVTMFNKGFLTNRPTAEHEFIKQVETRHGISFGQGYIGRPWSR